MAHQKIQHVPIVDHSPRIPAHVAVLDADEECSELCGYAVPVAVARAGRSGAADERSGGSRRCDADAAGAAAGSQAQRAAPLPPPASPPASLASLMTGECATRARLGDAILEPLDALRRRRPDDAAHRGGVAVKRQLFAAADAADEPQHQPGEDAVGVGGGSGRDTSSAIAREWLARCERLQVRFFCF